MVDRSYSFIADNCPICHETFLSVIALAEMAYAMDSPANSPYELGVTKLPTCGHYFCKKDLSKWIIVAKKDTCPTCRTPMGVQVVQDSPTAEAENGDQAPFPLPAEMEQQLQREMLRLREVGVLSAPGSMVDLGALLSGHADLRRTEFEYEETDRSEFPMYS